MAVDIWNLAIRSAMIWDYLFIRNSSKKWPTYSGYSLYSRDPIVYSKTNMTNQNKSISQYGHCQGYCVLSCVRSYGLRYGIQSVRNEGLSVYEVQKNWSAFQNDKLSWEPWSLRDEGSSHHGVRRSLCVLHDIFRETRIGRPPYVSVRLHGKPET